MDALIEAVRRYPCLWNTTAIEYRDQELKDAAWAEVMKETELSSVKEVKLKWKKLRDSYRDALKRQSELQAREPAGGGGGGGGGAKRAYSWRYMGSMQFLQPHMSARKKPAESPPPPAEARPPARLNGAAPPDRSDDDSDSEDSPPPKRKSDAGAGAGSAQLASLERKVASLWRARAPQGAYRRSPPAPAALPDPLDIFFNSMCQATKRLPYTTQIKIKKTLFAAVIEAEEACVAEQQSLAALWAAARTRSGSSEPDSGEPRPA